MCTFRIIKYPPEQSDFAIDIVIKQVELMSQSLEVLHISSYKTANVVTKK